MRQHALHVGNFLAGFPHYFKRGHWPQYYDLGAGQRFLACCSRGGGRSRNIFVFMPAPSPLY